MMAGCASVGDEAGEFPASGTDGCTEYLFRRAFLLDLSLMKEENAVRDIAGKAHFMRDDQHGSALFREIADDFENLADQFRI